MSREAFAEISKECKGILVVEMSIKGQTVPDVKLATKCGLSVYGYFSVDIVPDADIVVEIAEDIIAGTAQEV